MKKLDAVRWLGGSVAVYLVVAACSATVDVAAEVHARADSGGEGGGLLDAIADVLTDPVADARAEEPISGGRLKAEYLRGEDGSRSFRWWWDAHRNEPCSYTADKAGDPRCLPLERTLVAVDRLYGCPIHGHPRKVFAVPKGTPSQRYAFVQVGLTGQYEVRSDVAKYNVSKYEDENADTLGACALQDVDPAFDYYEFGDAVEPTAFVKGTVERDP